MSDIVRIKQALKSGDKLRLTTTGWWLIPKRRLDGRQLLSRNRYRPEPDGKLQKVETRIVMQFIAEHSPYIEETLDGFRSTTL